MKYIIAAVMVFCMLFAAGMVAKAVKSSAMYLDDSFRWGGRDG